MTHHIPSQFKRDQYLNLEGPIRRLSANIDKANFKANVVADFRIRDSQKCSRFSSGIYDRGGDSLAGDNDYFSKGKKASGQANGIYTNADGQVNGIYKEACGKAKLADAYGGAAKYDAKKVSGGDAYGEATKLNAGNSAYGEAYVAETYGKVAGFNGKAKFGASGKPVATGIAGTYGKASAGGGKAKIGVSVKPFEAGLGDPRGRASTCTQAVADGRIDMVKESSSFLLDDLKFNGQDKVGHMHEFKMQKAKDLDIDLKVKTINDLVEPYSGDDRLAFYRGIAANAGSFATGVTFAGLVEKHEELKGELQACYVKIKLLEQELGEEKDKPKGLSPAVQSRLDTIGFKSVNELINQFVILQDRVELAEQDNAFYRRRLCNLRDTSRNPLPFVKTVPQPLNPIKEEGLSSNHCDEVKEPELADKSEQLLQVEKQSCEEDKVAHAGKGLEENCSRSISESKEGIKSYGSGFHELLGEEIGHLGFVGVECNIDYKNLKKTNHRRPRYRICYICRKSGHFAKDCSRQKQRKSLKSKSFNFQEPGVIQLGAVYAKEVEDEPLFGKQALLGVSLDGFEVEALIDSGAKTSIISRALIGKVLRSKEVHNIVEVKHEDYMQEKLVGADGKLLKVINCLKIPLTWGKNPTKVAKFFVVQELQQDIVIGTNVLQGDPVWIKALCCALQDGKDEEKHIGMLYGAEMPTVAKVKKSTGKWQKEKKLNESRLVVAARGTNQAADVAGSTNIRVIDAVYPNFKRKEDTHRKAQQRKTFNSGDKDFDRDRSTQSKKPIAGQTWYNSNFYGRAHQSYSVDRGICSDAMKSSSIIKQQIKSTRDKSWSKKKEANAEKETQRLFKKNKKYLS